MLACRDVLEAAGPAFIKWGQWAATRHDLFPPDFCAILEHLHTQVPAPAVLITLGLFSPFSCQKIASQVPNSTMCASLGSASKVWQFSASEHAQRLTTLLSAMPMRGNASAVSWLTASAKATSCLYERI